MSLSHATIFSPAHSTNSKDFSLTMAPLTEIAGLSLSAASLAIQLGQVCDKLTNSFGKAAGNEEPVSSRAKLILALANEAEQTKLLKSVLFEDGKFGVKTTLFKEMDHGNQKTTAAIISQLSTIWTEAENLLETTLVSEHNPSRTLETTPSHLEHGNPHVLDDLQRLDKVAKEERLKRLAEATALWNSRLERKVQTYCWIFSLKDASPDETINRLSHIAEDIDAQRLQWIEAAKLRQMVLSFSNPALDRSILPIPDSLILERASISGVKTLYDGLVTGTVNREKVVVEMVKHETRSLEIEVMKMRIEQLVALLHLPKTPAFRIPKARGFYYDPGHTKFGIVFPMMYLTELRQTEILTLHRILEGSIPNRSAKSVFRRPSLSDRFALAHALALALSNIQSIGWVHQGIRSENIAFVVPSTTTGMVPYLEPWLFGYGASRPDSHTSVNLFDDDPIRNLYRHPDRWGDKPIARFTKLHDIYALGVVFLEIATWLPVAEMVNGSLKVRGASPLNVRKDLLSLARNRKVSERMGDAFSRIIELCLKADCKAFNFDERKDDKEDSLLQAAFREQVVDVVAKAVESLR